jgi:hypothetical protein
MRRRDVSLRRFNLALQFFCIYKTVCVGRLHVGRPREDSAKFLAKDKPSLPLPGVLFKSLYRAPNAQKRSSLMLRQNALA